MLEIMTLIGKVVVVSAIIIVIVEGYVRIKYWMENFIDNDYW